MRRVFGIPMLGLVCVVVAFVSGSAVVSAQSPDGITFPTSEVTIETQDGRSYPFVVEVAETPNQRALGLMFRESMEPDAGMLFLWDGEEPRAMWMKNTLIPLDMLFLDKRGVVLRVHSNAVPGDLTAIHSYAPAAAALEINAGTAKLLVIEPGDRVRHPALEG